MSKYDVTNTKKVGISVGLGDNQSYSFKEKETKPGMELDARSISILTELRFQLVPTAEPKPEVQHVAPPVHVEAPTPATVPDQTISVPPAQGPVGKGVADVGAILRLKKCKGRFSQPSSDIQA